MAYSRLVMPNVTSETTIENLFAKTYLLVSSCSFGIPERLVSDNGPHFSSSEFAEFSKRKGILKTHIGDTVQPKIKRSITSLSHSISLPWGFPQVARK